MQQPSQPWRSEALPLFINSLICYSGRSEACFSANAKPERKELPAFRLGSKFKVVGDDLLDD